MTRDRARVWTDNRLEEMERHIRQIYRQSYAEISAKWNAYMERGQERLADLHANYLSAPTEHKLAALQKYQDAVQNYTLRNQWYRDMLDTTTYRLAHVNEIALNYVNGELPNVYLTNFNYLDPEISNIGIVWTIRDENMIRNLIVDTLPEKRLNYAKDMAWNTRQINSSVLQGVIQGESIPKIAKRLLPVVDNNKAASIRTARTMVTGAENRGRQDRYEEYETQGVVMRKVWIATPDGRTRNWHLSMDGQEVDVDTPFIDGHGNPISYPGSPDGAPDSIYNCRCSMRSHLIGIRQSNGRVVDFKNYRTEASAHDKALDREKERRNG